MIHEPRQRCSTITMIVFLLVNHIQFMKMMSWLQEGRPEVLTVFYHLSLQSAPGVGDQSHASAHLSPSCFPKLTPTNSL